MTLALHFFLNGFGIATPRPFELPPYEVESGQATHRPSMVISQLIESEGLVFTDARVETYDGPNPRQGFVILAPTVLIKVRGDDKVTAETRAQAVYDNVRATYQKQVTIGTSRYTVKKVGLLAPMIANPEGNGEWSYSFPVIVFLTQNVNR
jgi:hypothetical protein